MPSPILLANARGSEALILSRDRQGAVIKKNDDPSRIEKTASEFESLLITQLLQSMRTESGWLGTGEDSSSASLIELAEQQLADQQQQLHILQARSAELEARLKQHSQNSSKPPSSDPPSAPPRPRR